MPAVTHARSDFEEAEKQFSGHPLFSHFLARSLTTPVRQNPDEQELLSLLSFVRSAMPSQQFPEEIEDVLKTRFQPGLELTEQFTAVSEFVFGQDNDGMVIAYTNESVNIFNDFMLNQMMASGAQIRTINSIITVNAGSSFRADEGNTFADTMNIQKNSNANIPATPFQEFKYYLALRSRRTKCIVPFRLKLTPGARVMLMRNIDVKQGLINGSRGTIDELVVNDGKVITVMVKFDLISTVPIPISRCLVNKYALFNKTEFSIFQFPLRLGWAVTAHKSQGQALSRAAINISEGAFAHGAFYVAISRVRRLDDIMPFGEKEWPENGISFHVNEYIRGTEIDVRGMTLNAD
jgi:hypothetical protein